MPTPGGPLGPELYQMAFYGMPAVVAIFGAGPVLLDASGSFYHTFGLSPAESRGQSFRRLFPCAAAKSDEPCAECGLQQCVQELLAHGPRIENLLFFHGQQCFQISGAGIEMPWGRAALLVFTDITEAQQKLEHLRQMLALDQITGLFNKTSITKILTRLLNGQPADKPFTVCLADMDDFKKINDSFGHLTGDFVLETFGQACRQNLGPRDAAGRFGGEEFLFLFLDADEAQAAELIRHIYADFAASLLRERGITVTLSGGLYSIPAGEPPPGFDHLVDACDNLLYAAKRAGKNQMRAPGNHYFFDGKSLQ